MGSERIDHGMRVKFNPLALLLDSSLEGEYDLVQRVIYDVRIQNRTFHLSTELLYGKLVSECQRRHNVIHTNIKLNI